ncbi:MAG: hypothetical protein AAGG38_11870 [Planctomycetota bacterium]
MSAKYKRVKQADEALPAPLRWLTRAFSSITLAVVLLCLVVVYGVMGSLPVYFMLIGAAWVATAGGALGLAGWLSVRLARRADWGGRRKLLAGAGLMLLGLGVTAALWVGSYRVVDGLAMFSESKAAVVYRLPMLEMNETEFFGWWPLQMILLLFVINMFWATVRRIEFKFVNLGVLTVHAGIITIGLGSVFYSQMKLEGDMFIVRSDLPGGRPVSHFYDRKMPALFVSFNATPAVQFELPELPRFNDYPVGELDIALHERPGYADKFGEHLRITIPGFLAYAEYGSSWIDSVTGAGGAASAGAGEAGPALVVARGDRGGASGDAERVTLPAARPAARVLEDTSWAVEYLHAPGAARLRDLATPLPPGTRHALLIEVPGQGHREVRAVRVGEAFEVGDTGYRITVEEIGPYALPFVTEGYQGAADTQATLQITPPREPDASAETGDAADAANEAQTIRRIVLHRYPERSQDFVDGQRGDPDPAIRVVYLDQSKVQVHLVTGHAEAGLEVGEVAEGAEGLWVLLRVAGIQPVFSPLAEGKLPVVDPDRAGAWLHVVDRLARAVQVQRPVATPRALRDPKIEGTYEKALVPVRVELDRVDADNRPTGETFTQTVWLRQMPYLEQRGGEMVPQTVELPGVGRLEISFGRRRQALPFAVAMTDFEMTPYEGSQIPRDFRSDLLVYPVDETGQANGTPERFSPRLNNPAIVEVDDAPLALRKIKLSQAGWDPGDPTTPEAAKQERDAQGRLINQQRFTILGVGNNVAIRVIAAGAVMMAVGIPWAFYVKPWLVQRRARRFNASLESRAKVEKEPDAQTPRKDPALVKDDLVLATEERG